MTDAIKITGLKEVHKKLYSYSQQLGDRVVIRALRAGANLMKRAVLANVPVGSRSHWVGLKSRGLFVSAGYLKKKGFVVARSKIHRGRFSTDMIGVYLALKKGKDAPFYGRFVNDGWNTRGEARTAQNTPGRWNRKGSKFLLSRGAIRAAGFKGGRTTLPGKTNVPGKHFIQNAFNSTKENAAHLIVETATAGAEVLARKVGLK